MTSPRTLNRPPSNSAFVDGYFPLYLRGILCATTSDLRASALSGGSRTALTVASYVLLHCHHWPWALVIWWLLILAHSPPALRYGSWQSLPLGVDSWIFVLLAWVACDGAGRFIGATFPLCWGDLEAVVFALIGCDSAGYLAGIAVCRSCGWSSPSSTSPATCPRCTPALCLLGLITLAWSPPPAGRLTASRAGIRRLG